ncbi:MAG: MerR family transcriptional regulator [Deltaproteobacteria bacterium]|nr:MAG: MerR family transcriptional regulator [Deltaproteobacteria bacterium]
MLGVRPHVLRYWETEFRGLKPAKSASGQRLYRQQDLLLLYRIRHLLYEERFTIEGARAKLKEAPTGTPSPAAPRPARDRRAGLLKLKEAVEDLLDFVDRHPGPGAKPGERGGG